MNAVSIERLAAGYNVMLDRSYRTSGARVADVFTGFRTATAFYIPIFLYTASGAGQFASALRLLADRHTHSGYSFCIWACLR